MAAVLLAAGCSPRQERGLVLPNQTTFRLTFGAGDATPADWSGSVEVAGGRVVSLASWRFDKDDKLNAQGNSWTCSTRLAAVLDPKYWWLGAVHVVPKDMAVPAGALIPNGLYVTVEGTSEVRVKTRQGDFSFRPADLHFGEPLKVLNGRAEVERAPAALNLTAGDGHEDDFPTVAFDSDSNAWAAWIGYQSEKEKIFVARTDGTGRKAIAEGEFFRPALAAGKGGRLYLAVSMRAGNTWRIAVATGRAGEWGKPEFISAGGPDLAPRIAADAAGKVWVVWQGFREGRSRILARRFDGNRWEGEVAISENTRNAWEPAVAADGAGRVHFAWDAYDGGNYDVYYRVHDGAKLGAQRRLTGSPGFEGRVSVACDRSNRAWIAWDAAGPNWGKDTGFLIAKNAGEPLYERRQARVAVLAESGMHAPKLPGGPFEQPRLVADARGSIWGLLRRRYTKLHEVWSQSLQRNRLQQYSLWDWVVVSFASPGGAAPITLPYGFGRHDLRAALAAAPAGRLTAVWAADGRSFAKPYPPLKSNLYAADIPGLPYGEPVLEPWTESSPDAKPVHPRESEYVAQVRAERIPYQGKTLRILRGDMHRHTDLSFDGDIDGSLWDFYRYAIDAADFDYCAITDHNSGDDNEYLWWLIQKSNDLFHYPGRFTPLYAYERSLRFPNGHRNLVWAKRGVRTLPRSKTEEDGIEGAAKLYAYLRRSGGLAMSHTSATWMGTDWRDNDPELEPLVEIYQGDRTSYEHESAPRAAKSKEPYSQPGGFKPEGFVWNAWAKGFKLGVQASSDHASTHVSYAVLLAEDTTREAVLAAIRARHAYAATDNIILDVRAGEHIQGDIFTVSERPRLEARVEGTAAVEKVEIIKNNKYVYSSRPNKASVKLTFEDADSRPGEAYYYVRVQQADGQMAWSSPMWITRK